MGGRLLAARPGHQPGPVADRDQAVHGHRPAARAVGRQRQPRHRLGPERSSPPPTCRPSCSSSPAPRCRARSARSCGSAPGDLGLGGGPDQRDRGDRGQPRARRAPRRIANAYARAFVGWSTATAISNLAIAENQLSSQIDAIGKEIGRLPASAAAQVDRALQPAGGAQGAARPAPGGRGDRDHRA